MEIKLIPHHQKDMTFCFLRRTSILLLMIAAIYVMQFVLVNADENATHQIGQRRYVPSPPPAPIANQATHMSPVTNLSEPPPPLSLYP
ncbi:hypothetical protein L1049_006191 [Liquidambar formosana]|uniref:Uncharacterized protein n=1 Tax=Liquidambar formosana TaxID=63359 RepID=A0AAP0WTX1_LIQFO